MVEKIDSRVLVVRQVVHSHRDDANCSRDQFLWAAAFGAMPLHVIHRAVMSVGQPRVQAGLCLIECDITDTELLEAEFPRPSFDVVTKRLQIAVSLR